MRLEAIANLDFFSISSVQCSKINKVINSREFHEKTLILHYDVGKSTKSKHEDKFFLLPVTKFGASIGREYIKPSLCTATNKNEEA